MVINMNIKNLTIEYHLVDSCNLKCAGCSHYSSLLDKLTYPQLNDIINDLTFLKSKIGDTITRLKLLGGEPLLHPQICECLIAIRNIFQNANIAIITNGLLLNKMSEQFYTICKDLNIQIEITDYKLLNIISVLQKLISFGISTKLYRLSKVWRYKHIRLNGDSIDCLSNCMFEKACLNYRDGKLYLCPHIAYINIFNDYFGKNIKLDETDYILIDDVNSFENLVEKVNSAQPNFCYRYCNYYDKKHPEIGKWCITKKDINEFCLL